MRRTYRSKKDTGGALDHKDVLLTLDEGSSAFDGFYMQKLKQTKRELSCVGSSSQYVSATNKGRKKKFVKRILKDVENTPGESIQSMSKSTYLTPDKSIRVNRGQDLFDQLLDTPRRTELKKNDDLFYQFRNSRQIKTYGTKRPRRVKKHNYSNSESNDTDKENETTDISTNVTDIRAHKLIVEKDSANSPTYQDESINKIVQNLSLFNNLKNCNSSSGSPVISFSKHVRIGSKSSSQQLQSTVLEKSVLSSTPFKSIRTATSIYKFSPISSISEIGKNNVTVPEENDQDIIDALNSLKAKNPLVFDINKIDVSEISVIENNKTEQAFNGDNEEQENVPKAFENLECISVLSDSVNGSSLDISLGGSKPSEVFLGFSHNATDDQKHHESVINIIDKDVSTNAKTSGSELEISLGGSKPSEPFFGFSLIDDKQSINVSNYSRNSEKTDKSDSSKSNSSIYSQSAVSLYDTCSSDKYAELSNELNKEPIVNVTKMDDVLFQDYFNKMNPYSSDVSGDEDMDESSEASDEEDITEEQNSSNSEYDPVYQRNDVPQSTVNPIDSVEVVDSDDYSNFNEQSQKVSDSSQTDTDGATISPQESESESETSMFDELDSDSNGDRNDDNEVRCFVSTRRKVIIKSDSSKSSLNDSSSNSSECDKTVVSNNKVAITDSNDEKTDTLLNKEFVNEEIEDINNLHRNEVDMDCSEVEENIEVDTRLSFVTTRKSSRRFSDLPSSPDCSVDKPVIVLQPGKKWERSLSIYKRMTMMNDHDRSILDESLDCKGRKYRQSVISTMEMQEGSLHNESISSRRSTLVAKPCRSTIAIVKEPNNSRISVFNNTVYDDLKGFLSDDCDDTIVELTKLSIADSDHEVTVVEKVHEERSTTARDYVLRRCNQTDIILFDECYPDTALKNCHKIGEGVYGEVFLWRARDGRARVMKIVPVAGTTKVNGENQKDFHEIISEIVIAMELSALRTPVADLERQFDEGKKDVDTLDLHAIQNATDIFNEVLAVRCVYGSYTSRLLDLWELYDECKGSENDNPAILPSDQQYIVLELANAGQDLESYQFNSAEQAHALFLQVAFGLAVGEEAFQFEHRDLHWGNVLIAPTEQKFATFVLRGRSHAVPRCGVAATIIDYSLSRLSLPLATCGSSAALYNDLAGDDGLFDAVGDYQFEVYRLMREKLGNDWKNFEPYTNILWLHYTVDKMITALRYKRTNTKIHKHYISKLKAIKNRILSYGSAVQFVLTDNEY